MKTEYILQVNPIANNRVLQSDRFKHTFHPADSSQRDTEGSLSSKLHRQTLCGMWD